MSLTPHIKIIFIVPYRDRKQHYDIFSEHMKTILEDIEPTDYDIFYIHQTDTRSFNRGAMKNIGFLYVKDKYPDTYKDITLVFNDNTIVILYNCHLTEKRSIFKTFLLTLTSIH